MKHLKLYEEFSKPSFGEEVLSGIGDIRLTYPYEEIWNEIGDFVQTNQESWEVAGWGIFDAIGNEELDSKYLSPSNSFFRVEKFDELHNQEHGVMDYLDNDDQARDKAIIQGFMLDDDGVVIGFKGVNLLDKYN